ncbi:hypothetical protein [Streptomyces sp. NPDC046821]|uniref:hypothetical protein n=1 Tax=Streptomyces sp. NPDC046821 TaxID=3154702 RepID=UPI0033D8D09F
MKEISRRTVLAGTAVSTVALGLPASTAVAEPAGDEPPPTTAEGKLGSSPISVTAREVQDVTGLQYVITNGGSRPMTYVVWYVDVTGGPASGRVTETAEAGESVAGYFYGAVHHCFTLHVSDEAGAESAVLGPVCGHGASSW